MVSPIEFRPLKRPQQNAVVVAPCPPRFSTCLTPFNLNETRLIYLNGKVIQISLETPGCVSAASFPLSWRCPFEFQGPSLS
jgi:hypothetical protein